MTNYLTVQFFCQLISTLSRSSREDFLSPPGCLAVELLDNDYRDVKNYDGNVRYRIKDCVDDFPYDYYDENGKKHTVKLREKRVVTFNPKLAEKQMFEINKQVEKASLLKASQAKRSEFGDSAKYVSFVSADSLNTLR